MLLLQVSCDNFCNLASIMVVCLKVHAGAVKIIDRHPTETEMESERERQRRGEWNGVVEQDRQMGSR